MMSMGLKCGPGNNVTFLGGAEGIRTPYLLTARLSAYMKYDSLRYKILIFDLFDYVVLRSKMFMVMGGNK
jgi:hypothetical protein